ncbi:hypothetical protein MKZ02_12050 [Pseudobacillus sp. FSL P4-0506]|uniref:hypothetical protein n=1 Tax=Pseudobacillus sp. FSL P4-0506 TaxID=2921576 RepID=UPI0030F587E0
MNYISGGYYVISPSKRANYMDQSLLPEIIVSASECLCDLHPEINILWGDSQKNKRNYAEKWNLSRSIFEKMERWVVDKFEEGTFQFPQVFTTVDIARDFAHMFLSHLNDIKIIGVALPESLVGEFLDEEETLSLPAKERYGVEALLMNKIPVDTEASMLNGYEVLGFECGTFHSYICNGLEKDYSDKFTFSLNEKGLIPTLEMAMKYCEYSNDERIGTEPVLWLPWAIYEYKF